MMTELDLKKIIEQGLEDLEDYCLAADVLERVRQGREAVHSTTDVRKALGLDADGTVELC